MQELDSRLMEAFTAFPYSVEIMMHVATKLKAVFLECGAGFPILLLHGLPANGKTSTVKACLTDEDVSMKFAEGLKAVKEAMDKESGEHVMLIDNYPRFLSHYKREKSLRILDYVIDVASETADIPSIIITAEPNILEDLQKSESLRERMLLIPVPEIGTDEKLSAIRSYLTQYREQYLCLMKRFDEWLKENQIDKEEVRRGLAAFREANKRYAVRFTGLVFTYYYACIIFSKFLESEYGMLVVKENIEKNVRQLFIWKENEKQIKTSVAVEVWEMLIENKNAFEVYEPNLGVCKLLLNGECQGKQNEYNCSYCYDLDGTELYNPMELNVTASNDKDKSRVILIEKPSLIPWFPTHIKCDTPLLIIENRTLFEMMNMCLQEYSRRKQISVMPFSPKKLNKDFFINNLCLFEYVGCNHNSYTFPMPMLKSDMDSGTNIRVMFMKLKQEQYEVLKERATKSPYSLCYSRNEVNNMRRCLKTICSNVQSLFGEIGVASKVIER